MVRETVDFKKPLHLTLKLRDNVDISLRNPGFLKTFQNCCLAAKKHKLHVLHFSIESNHLHMIVECENNRALTTGMKSLAGTLGKTIRKICGGTGAVFKGRFHMRVLRNPTQRKNGLAYVLLNQSKHEGLIPYVDRYSSAEHFRAWKKLLGKRMGPLLPRSPRSRELPSYLSLPQSWLIREGWLRAR